MKQPGPVEAYTYLSDELERLAESAYALFPVQQPKSLEVCTSCCMELERETEILNTPRDQVTLKMLSDWLGAAFCDGPEGAQSFFWLLPSLCKYLGQGRDDLFPCGLEIALIRAERTGFPIREWSGEQQEWINRFAFELLMARCSEPVPELDVYLCMLMNGGLSEDQTLEIFKTLPLQTLTKGMQRDIENGHLIGCSQFWLDVWDSGRGFLRKLRDWFQSDQLLNELLETSTNQKAEPEISAAIDWLPWPLDNRVLHIL